MEQAKQFASKLGFGCMRLPQTDPADPTSIDMEHFTQMVDAFMNAGGTYFDTAFVYHNGASEKALKEALTSRYPREAYTIATKCLAWAMPSKEAAQSNLDTSLERMGIDYVDFYLLHNVGDERVARFDEYDMWNFVKEQKAAGKIRHWGFSMHAGPECLDEVLTAHPDTEFVQLQVNYLDWEDPITQSRACMEVAAKHGVPVIIMEPARGGNLVNMPDAVKAPLLEQNPDESMISWAYRYCMELPNVLTTLTGASTLEQMEENVQIMNEAKPLSDDEHAALAKAVDALHELGNIPCTNCKYCVKDCPGAVNIPQVLELLNLVKQTDNVAFAKDLYSWQTIGGRASQCIECGLCESMCPQSIGIIDHLKEAVEVFE